MHKASQVTEQVMQYIKEQIAGGEWPLDSRIPSENELCRLLGVSRTSVRAALQRFNVLGILESQHGRGTFVRSDKVYIPGPKELRLNALSQTDEMTKETFREWRQARNVIEPEIAYYVAEAATPELVRKLKRINREQEQLIGQQELFIQKDKEYHMALAEFLGNKLIMQCLESLLNMREMQLFVNDKFGYMGGIYFHAMITDAISRHNADRARTLMLEHGRDEEQSSRIFDGLAERETLDASLPANALLRVTEKEKRQ